MRRSNFNKSVRWHEITAEVGLARLRVHDLRHTWNMLVLVAADAQREDPEQGTGA